MGYQSIVNDIRSAATSCNNYGTFINGRKWDVSVEDFEGAKPAIYLYPITTAVNDQQFTISTHKVVMAFCDYDNPDSSDGEREVIISNMDVLSNQFLVYLNDITEGTITGITKEPFFRQFSGTFSGYYLSFTITDTNYIC